MLNASLCECVVRRGLSTSSSHHWWTERLLDSK